MQKYRIESVSGFVSLLGDEVSPSCYQNLEAQGLIDPLDEEAQAHYLNQDWDGNSKGAIVIHGLTVTGHPFLIVP